MRKMIILNKDQSVKVVKNLSSKTIDNSKYILVPIEEYDIGSFVMLKPNKYFADFDHANICFSSMITKEALDPDFGHISGYAYIHDLDNVDKVVYSFVEFINYLHSLNKLSYINSLSNASEVESNVSSIKFSYFRIDIYNRKNLIYHKELAYPDYQFLRPENVLHEIEDIYTPIIRDKKEGLSDEDFIRIRDEKWKFTSSISNNGLFGITMFKTKSVYFTIPEVIRVLKLCKSVYSANFQYNSHDYENYYSPEIIATEWPELYYADDLPPDYGFRTYDVWYTAVGDIVEHITHLKCIYIILTVLTEYETFQEITGKISTNTAMIIEPEKSYNDEINIHFSGENILTLDEFIKKIIDTWIIK